MSRFEPPLMTNGKTWADEDWWHATAIWKRPDATTMDEAAEVAWARCWAYIRSRDLPPEVCQHIWPVVYGALAACYDATDLPADRAPERGQA